MPIQLHMIVLLLPQVIWRLFPGVELRGSISTRQCVRIRSAASVLLVGGDPTGVELAAEIVYNFPEKKVILAHRGLRPLEFIGFKASQKALDWLASKKEIKQGYLAQKHAQVVVKNLKLLLAGGDESKMATYSTCFEMAIVFLGKKEAVAQLPLLTISGCILA